VGGSATALVSLAGGLLDPPVLQRALELLTRRSVAEVAADTGLGAERVRLLPAGLLILLEASLRFDQPLLTVSGGLREGVLLAAAAGS
jgi:exopolyphosphatase/pppGpp-phosphohydrolase